MKKLLIIILIFTSSLYSQITKFEFDSSIGIGFPIEFTYRKGGAFFYIDKKEVNFGNTFNTIISLGANTSISNDVLTSISSMFETGYNIYFRTVRGYNSFKEYKDYHYIYHNIILGYLLRLNFKDGFSSYIGAGIYVPLYLTADNTDDFVAKFDEKKSFSHKDIATIHKLPFMPYIKLGFSRYIDYTDKIAGKVDINVLYNFGMELDKANINDGPYFLVYRSYKFSYLSFEIAYGLSFGKPDNYKFKN